MVVKQMDASLIYQADNCWRDYLNKIQIHDFYHRPEYVQICADRKHATACAVVVEEGESLFFVPLLLKNIPNNNSYRDAESPYGYASPLVHVGNDRSDDGNFIYHAFLSFKEVLADQNIVSAFLRMHPLLPLTSREISNKFSNDLFAVVDHGETVFIDLSESDEKQLADMKAKFRYYINRAKRDGLVAKVDTEWEYLDAFVGLYTETMSRLEAGQDYFFPKSYFEKLRDGLGDVMNLVVVLADGALVAGGLFSETSGIVQYHLSATVRSPEMDKLCPNRLLLDHVRRWATKRGNQAFHLGGGLNAQKDSLFQFKAGFSASRKNYLTWRLVVNQPAYQSLLPKCTSQVEHVTNELDGYFPAYRVH